MGEQYAKELHKPVRRPPVSRQVITSGIDDVWASDLMDMQWMDKAPGFVNTNDGYRWVAVYVDAYTRYAWCIPQKTAGAEETWKGLEKIMAESGRKPRHLWVDQGGSYTGAAFKRKAKKEGIEIYHTYGPHKSVLAERFNRTLGEMIWHKFTELQTRKWVPLLPELVEQYNNRPHRGLGGKMTPAEASVDSKDEAKEDRLWLRQYGHVQPNIEPKLKVGDWVRIARSKGLFEKGYHANWSGEVFQIREVKTGRPPLYHLRDFAGEDVEGAFYESELQATQDPRDPEYNWLIESVLKKRKYKGKEEVLVHFLGWPAKFDRWLPAEDVSAAGA